MTTHDPSSQTLPDDRIAAMVAFTVEHLCLDIDPAKAAGQSLPALGIDSLEFMSLVMALEEAFHVELDLDRLEGRGTDGKAMTLADTLRVMSSKQE